MVRLSSSTAANPIHFEVLYPHNSRLTKVQQMQYFWELPRQKQLPLQKQLQLQKNNDTCRKKPVLLFSASFANVLLTLISKSLDSINILCSLPGRNHSIRYYLLANILQRRKKPALRQISFASDFLACLSVPRVRYEPKLAPYATCLG